MSRSRALHFFALASLCVANASFPTAPARLATAASVAAALDAPPVVNAPSLVDGDEGAPLEFDVTVTEPDGDEIVDLRADGLPAGATFEPDASNAAAHFAWTPDFDQAGAFSIRITARSVSRAVSVSEPIPLEGTADVDLVVADVNRPPVIVPLPDVLVPGGASATIQMLATDPDGGGSFDYALVSGPPYVSRVNAFLYMVPALADTGEADVVYSISDHQATSVGSVHVIVTGAPPCADSPIATAPPYRVLIDASRDDGLWWAPQDLPNDPAQPHVGKRLADNLRGRGMQVFELARRSDGSVTPVISFEQLASHDLVIRPSGRFYAASELGAYSCYLANGGRLVLLSEALPPGEEDLLATWLGFDYRGESRGENRVSTFAPHPITEGVPTLVYGVGSGLFGAPALATTLGSLSAETFIDLDGDGLEGPGEPAAAPVMGVVQFGEGVCFFLGDTSMFLGVSQPLLDNLLGYFFDDRSPPALEQPADMTVRAGATAEQTLRGSDPDGATDLIFNRVDGPRYMRVVDAGASTGLIRLTPRLSEVGAAVGIVRVTDGILEDRKTLRLTVTEANAPPVANAGGPYEGTVGAAVELRGDGSSDPDGDALQYDWEFGDGVLGVGAVVLHTYDAGGTFRVVLAVSDGTASDRDTTECQVSDVLAARAFLPDGHRSIPLGAGAATVCFQIEPVDGAYENATVDPSRWTMFSSAAAPGGRAIAAVEGKSTTVADRDRNSVEETTACFRREDLRLLAPDLRGRGELPVRIEGALVGGALLHAPITLTVVGLGRGNALVTPNPARGSATLLFHTEKAGPVTIRLFDARGRLVRRIHSNGASGVGYHEVVMEARDADGAPLPSGAYFYRIDAPEGRTTGRWIVVR